MRQVTRGVDSTESTSLESALQRIFDKIIVVPPEGSRKITLGRFVFPMPLKLKTYPDNQRRRYLVHRSNYY